MLESNLQYISHVNVSVRVENTPYKGDRDTYVERIFNIYIYLSICAISLLVEQALRDIVRS